MKSLRSMGKTKSKNSAEQALGESSPTKMQRSAPLVKMAMQDRAVDYIKSGNIEGLSAMAADGSSELGFVNKFHSKSGMHPLAVAADESNNAAAELLIKAGADVNLVDMQGMSALFYAAGQTYESVVETLIAGGADVNAVNEFTGETPVHVAAKRMFNAIAILLDFKGAPVDIPDKRQETPLTISLKLENFALCDFLLTRDCRINATSEFGDTPLIRSAFDGRMGTARYILEHGGDVHHQNSNGENALLIACRHGNLPMVEALLQYGARVTDADNTGKTPLMVATMAGKHNVVQKLLAHDNVDVSQVDLWGYTALACACMAQPINHALLHDLLRAKTVNVNQQDRAFDTPLMHAARRQDLRAMQMLLECGADPLLSNIDARIPEDELQDPALKKAFLEEASRWGFADQARREGSKPRWVLDLQHRRAGKGK